MTSPSVHRGPAPKVLSIVLAGGEGRRLWPLTADRAKPAVPMAGRYRLIDFALSNFVNSGLLKIKVLTQYKSDSLNTHIARGWRLPAFLDLYVEVVPAQQRTGGSWFKGSADAIHQSLNVITDEDPDMVLVFGGDHVYKMDVRQMLDFHLEVGAECTVAVDNSGCNRPVRLRFSGSDPELAVQFRFEPPANRHHRCAHAG